MKTTNLTIAIAAMLIGLMFIVEAIASNQPLIFVFALICGEIARRALTRGKPTASSKVQGSSQPEPEDSGATSSMAEFRSGNDDLDDNTRQMADRLKTFLAEKRSEKIAQERARLERARAQAQEERQARYQDEMRRAGEIVAAISERLENNDESGWIGVMELHQGEVERDYEKERGTQPIWKLAPEADAAQYVVKFLEAVGLRYSIDLNNSEGSLTNLSRDGIYNMKVYVA